MLKLTNNTHGQTLIEVILSVGISILIVSAIVVLGVVSLRITKASLRRSEAGKLASAGIEAVRYVRNADGVTCGFANISVGCYEIDNSGSADLCGVLNKSSDNPSTCTGTDLILEGEEYNRIIKVEEYGGSTDKLLVTSTASWKESSAVKTVSISTILTDIGK